MSRSVELPESVYAALEAAASAAGTTPAEWIAAQLPPLSREPQPQCDEHPARTLADEFAGRVGLFSSEESGAPPPTLAERLAGRVGLIHSGRSNRPGGPDAMFRDAGEEHEPLVVGASQRVLAISDEVYRDLEEEALAFGTTPEEWIAARVPRHSPASGADLDQQPARTLAEQFEGYLGLVSLDRTDLGARAGELFAEGMEEKHREHRL
jgi:hypothetical protein